MNKNNKLKVGAAFIAVSMLVTFALTTASERNSEYQKKEADVVFTDDNTVVIRGPIMDESVGNTIKALRELDTKKNVGKPIYLVLYTPGGSIQAGIELIDAAKGIRRPIKTVTLFAASMGFQIAQGLGDRLITSGGVLMSHKASGGVEGEFGPGNDSQLDKRINFWKSRLLEMDKQTVMRTKGKQTLQSYQTSYENELWLTGAGAVAEGYADRVVTLRCSESTRGTTTQNVSFMGMNISVKFSKCPLQKSPEEVSMKIKTNKGNMSVEEFTSRGGILGIDCTTAKSRFSNADGEVLCAVDGSLTKEKIAEEREKIIELYSIDGMKKNIGYKW